MNDIDRLLQGAIDMHLHHGPDTMPMRVDAIEAARQAKNAGMKAIVLKNHLYPTAPLATLARQLVPDIDVFGSICLDYEVGSLNYHAVEASAKLGAKVVWMPTSSSTNVKAKMVDSSKGQETEDKGCPVLDKNGVLVPAIHRILLLIKEYDMVLASGHISASETLALFDEAQRIGIQKLIVTHANVSDFFKETLSLEQQKHLAARGVFIEFTAAEIMPCDLGHNPVEMAKIIKAIGAQYCIMSGDMGLVWTLLPPEGMRAFISSMMLQGISSDEIELMVKVNPAKLLGLN